MRFYYDSIADDFISLANPYDVKTRLRIVFDELLKGKNVEGQFILDAGCGYGVFTDEARSRGADVVASDISFKLVKKTKAQSFTDGVVSDACTLAFADVVFDIVISSEMLEHTECDSDAFWNLTRVIKPGGFLVLTTPNKLWQWIVVLASKMKLRPFQGIERFIGWKELEQLCDQSNLEIKAHWGFHPWPFQFAFLIRLSQKVDQLLGKTFFGRVMINQAVLAQKRSS
ncbi:MAG: methyltransferase domain-containing protein [Desulfobacteraceae bacterium]|nr:methyltransferase domain-containing protein [Desulfobacteraceae bacterium]